MLLSFKPYTPVFSLCEERDVRTAHSRAPRGAARPAAVQGQRPALELGADSAARPMGCFYPKDSLKAQVGIGPAGSAGVSGNCAK